MTKRFTDLYIQRLVCPQDKKDFLVFDNETKGLGLRITSAGNKGFLVQWRDRSTQKKRRLPLGMWGSITLKTARDAAKIHLGTVAKGGDPIADLEAGEAREEAKQQELKLTLEKLIEAWESNHLAQRSESYKNKAPGALRRGFSEFLKRPAIRLSKDDAVMLLDEMKENNGPAIAARTRSYGHAMYQWAIKRSMLASNPFENLPFEVVRSQRDRVLSNEELGKVYKAAGTIAYPYGAYHQLVAMTGQRVNEVAGMRWSEISKDYSTWTLPSSRTKNNKEHIVHLSEPAHGILRRLRTAPTFNKKSDFVFTTTGKTPISGFSKAKKRLDGVSGVSNWVEHDWRRTVVTGLAKMGVDHVVADKLLNHQEGTLSSIARVYQQNDYLPQRKEALDKWGKHVVACADKAKLPEPKEAQKSDDKRQVKARASKL